MTVDGSRPEGGAGRSAGRITLMRGATLVLTFAGSVVLARVLPVPDRGAFAVLTAGTVAAAYVLALGTHTGAYVLATGRGAPTGVLATNAVAFGGLAAALTWGVLAVPAIDDALPGGLRSVALWPAPAVVAVGAFVINFHHTMLAWARRQAFWGAVISVAPFALAATGYLVLLAPAGGDLDLAVWTFAGAAGLAVLLGMLPLQGLDFAPRRRPSPRLLGRSVQQGLRGYGTDVANILHQRVSVLLVAGLSSASAAAVYTVAYQTVEPLLAVAAAASATALAHEHGTTGTERAGAVTAALIRSTLPAMTALAVLAALVAPVLVPLVYGEEFADSVPVLLVLLPGLVAWATGKVAHSHLISHHRLESATLISLGGLAVNVAANLALIPPYGAVGAGVAALLSYLVFAGAAVAVFARDTRLPMTRLVPRPRDAVRTWRAAARRR